MTRKITQKELKHDEFVEAAFDLGHWFEAHWRSVAQVLAALLVVVIAVVSWVVWSQQRLEQAKQRLADGIERYQAAQAASGPDAAIVEEALAILDEAERRLRGKPAGSLAQFYRGAALADLGRTDEAREALRQVVAASGPEDTVGASARLLLARVEAAGGGSADALALLGELAEQRDTLVPPDAALLEMARIHEAAGRLDQARALWQRILDEHPDGAAAAEARARVP